MEVVNTNCVTSVSSPTISTNRHPQPTNESSVQLSEHLAGKGRSSASPSSSIPTGPVPANVLRRPAGETRITRKLAPSAITMPPLPSTATPTGRVTRACAGDTRRPEPQRKKNQSQERRRCRL
eukprot:666902-Pyramimonas_sp.AAC.1